MIFDPFEVTTPHVIYALLGGFIVLFGMFSLFLRERLYVGEAVWAFIFGIVIGPYCANIFNPRAWGGNSDEVTNDITLEFTRIVLAIGVFAIGVELPKAYMAKHWRSLFFLLVPVMTWGWFVSAGLIYALIPGLNFLSSLAVAACLTPTDPILAAAVVGGKWADKHVPAHLRHLLAAESGCNDGAAFPFLFLALYLIIDGTTGAAVRDWFLQLWLYQVVLGAIIGSMMGFSFRHLMKFCQRHDLIDRQSYVAQYVSLAIFTIGVTTLLGSDDLLSAFFCGTAFAWDGFFNRQTEESVFSSVIDTLFNVAAFIFVGAWIPFDKFQDAALTLSVWRLIVLAILVLLLRRLPIMILLYRWIPDIKTFREAVFSGHFGPIGIGAVFISTLAVGVLHDANQEDDKQMRLLEETIQPIVAFMVLCSITIHGLSIPSFSLGRRVHSVSRTWSRRDTTGSGGPEWANQARMVTRAEDIVINRDREDTDHPDLEMGEGGQKAALALASEKEKVKLERSSLHSTRESVHTLETVDARMADSDLTDETKVHPGGGGGASGGATREPSPESRFAPAPEEPHDYRAQNPPDGDDNMMEWIEGSHRIIEKKMGPGSDVEVTVLNADRAAEGSIHKTWKGKIHELESEIRPAIKKELAHLTSKAKDAMESISPVPSRRPSLTLSKDKQKEKSEPAPADAVESALDDEDGWASEGSNGPRERLVESARKMARSTSKPVKGVHTVHHASHQQRKRRASVRRNSTSTGTDIVEEPRGRSEGRADPSVTFVSAQHPNNARPSAAARLGTAPTAGRAAGAGSRPSTADNNARHSRLETIRAMHSAPPTRESSPSRSVRFADAEGRNGSGPRNLGVDRDRDESRSTSPMPPSGESAD